MLSNVEHMALSEKRKRKTMDGGRAISFPTHFGGCGTYSNLPLCPLFTQLHSYAAESLFPHLYYLLGLLTLQLINQQWPFFLGHLHLVYSLHAVLHAICLKCYRVKSRAISACFLRSWPVSVTVAKGQLEIFSSHVCFSVHIKLILD